MSGLKIRPGIGSFRDSDGHLRFVNYAKSLHKIFKAEEHAFFLVSHLDGTHDEEELFELVCKQYPRITREQLLSILQLLHFENLLEHTYEDIAGSFTESEVERYSRQVAFWAEFINYDIDPWDLQKKIKGSRVAVIGLGGTGTWMVQSLTLAGVGSLRLIDFDNVELSNLNRQVLYSAKDIGVAKLSAARKHIESVNPDIEVETTRLKIGAPEDITASHVLDACDLIINCADYPDINITSDWISQSCMPLEIPHIVGGGYSAHIGLIGPTIIPGKTACWRCYREEAEKRRLTGLINLLPDSPRRTGSVAPIASIVANIQAWDALRVLSGLQPILVDRTGELEFDTLEIRWHVIDEPKNCRHFPQ